MGVLGGTKVNSSPVEESAAYRALDYRPIATVCRSPGRYNNKALFGRRKYQFRTKMNVAPVFTGIVVFCHIPFCPFVFAPLLAPSGALTAIPTY